MSKQQKEKDILRGKILQITKTNKNSIKTNGKKSRNSS